MSLHALRVLSFRFWIAALILPIAMPLPAAGQNPPLGEVAKKEQQRRKAAKPSQKVLTNDDLPSAGVQPPAPATGGSTGADAAPKPAEQTAAAKDAKVEQKLQKESKEERGEEWWRTRISQAREALRRSEAFAEALQSRVNALSAEFVNRDDPYQRAKIGEDRQKALAEMDRVKTEIELQRKQIADIEEEARKAAVPPGWLR
jgi:hypothetical protein